MQIKSKKYGYSDYFSAVYSCAPLEATIHLILTVLSGFLPALTVFATADFVDTAIAIFNGAAETNEIIMPLLGIIGVNAYGYIMSAINSFIWSRFSSKVEMGISIAFFEKKAKIQYKCIEDNDTYDLIAMASAENTTRFMSRFNLVASIISVVISIVSIVVIIVSEIWWVSIITVAIGIPIMLINIKNSRLRYKASEEAERYQRFAGNLGSMLCAKDFLEERNTFKYTPFIKEKWHEHHQKAQKINFDATTKQNRRNILTSLLSYIASFIVSLCLIFPLGKGEITIGMFIGLSTAIGNFIHTVSNFAGSTASTLTAMKIYNGYMSGFAQLEETPDALEKPKDMTDFDFRTLEFRNVTFAYPGTEREILKNCSFTLEAGKHYAFVGINGAGKTTITKLITGLYGNYTGEILINGKEIKEYSFAELKGLYSVVWQDFASYYIKLKDAIKLGNINKDSDEDMYAAISKIELDRVVKNLPDGIESYLGKINEGGVDLSGGEWQRVAIARCLYRNAPITILDEPTAALDPVSESNIYNIFKTISEGKSVIFITHRLGAARIADEILVIHAGKVLERGSHSELIEKGGMYADMFNTQKEWYE